MKKSDAEQVVGEDQLVCELTGLVKKATPKEQALQSVIGMLTEEYGFELKDMGRDVSIPIEEEDGQSRRMKVDIAIWKAGTEHLPDNIERICVVQDEKVKDSDAKKGVEPTIERILTSTEIQYGLWTNGADMFFKLRRENDYRQAVIEDIADMPDQGKTMEDLERRADRVTPRKPANDTLVKTFKRCHDYIYGNEGMKKTAFWELLNLIFCKIYDEKRRFMMKNGETYRRRFWVGAKERFTEEGQKAIHDRICSLFEELKQNGLFSEVFDGNEQINLSPRGLAFVAGELAKYSFLDATVDVKGTAYETIVSNTLKQEAGQFFTPRNIIKCMVEMLDPDENTRVLDPACGSGGFLVMVLDHVRRKVAKSIYPDLDGVRLEGKFNSREVNERVKNYAEDLIFGFDFDPDLKKASRMNMVMAGDGHANIFNVNSLALPGGDKPDVQKVKVKIKASIRHHRDHDLETNFADDDVRGKFDMIFTNPPFGSKVEVDIAISRGFELGRTWSQNEDGSWKDVESSSSEAPEVLFIEQCWHFLKPGGKLAIVLPDGILGNPDHESTRHWMLDHFKLLASVDLPVEAFLPQVGVQASLLFLQKKTEAEKLAAAGGKEDYDVFMAVARTVGKDRRGVPINLRDEDGAELSFKEQRKTLFHTADGGEKIITKQVSVKHRDDDLPEIAKAYQDFLKGRKKGSRK